jgi:hypothetical protein
VATKPATSPRVWDSAGIYTTGPFIGSISISDPGAGIAAEGHRPGASYPTAAEHENYQQNKVTAYVANWLALGSSAGAADAHIVETDAAGRATLHGLDVINPADETAVDITSSSTFAPAVSISCSTGAQGLSVNLGGAAAVGVSSNVSNGVGVGFSSEMIGSPAGARGVRVTADATSDGAGIEVAHEGAGSGIEVAHVGTGAAIVVNAASAGIVVNGGPAGYAFDVVADAGAIYGARFTGGIFYAIEVVGTANGGGGAFTGSGAGIGVAATSGLTAGSHAVNATARNATGNAVRAESHTTSSAPAIYADGKDSAPGVSANSANSYAILCNAKVNAPALPAIFVNPQAANPSTVVNGGISYNGTTEHWVVGDTDDGAYRDLWSSRKGFCYGAEYAARATNNNAAVYTLLCTAAMAGGSAPKTAGTILCITVSLRVRVTTAGTPTSCDIQLVDSVDGTIITYAGNSNTSTSGYHIPGTTVNWANTISLVFAHTVVTPGNRNIVLNFKTSAAVAVEAQGSLVVTGGY